MRYSSLLASVFLTGAMIMPVGGLYADSSFQSAGSAQAIIQDTGVANRLTAAQVLLSWTQAVPAAACHLHNQVNVADAAELLAVGDAQVEEVLNALLDGDIFWGIETPETRRKTIAGIEQLRATWAPAQQAARRLLETPTDKDAALILTQASDDLREQTYQLATMLDAQYSSSAEIQARDIMFIQLAGRLVTLNQQMALQACLLWSEGMDQTIADELKQTIQAYNGTLSALSNGLPQMSILPPQTPGHRGQAWKRLAVSGFEISRCSISLPWMKRYLINSDLISTTT